MLAIFNICYRYTFHVLGNILIAIFVPFTVLSTSVNASSFSTHFLIDQRNKMLFCLCCLLYITGIPLRYFFAILIPSLFPSRTTDGIMRFSYSPNHMTAQSLRYIRTIIAVTTYQIVEIREYVHLATQQHGRPSHRFRASQSHFRI